MKAIAAIFPKNFSEHENRDAYYSKSESMILA